MLAELKKITNFLKSDKDAREIRKQILLILAVFLALLLANRFLFGNYADRGEYYLSIIRAKIAFAGNASVYEVDINPAQEELSKIRIDAFDSSEPFYLPLYALIIYYPLSLIKSFDWSLAIWMTVNQILVYFIIREFLKVIRWQIESKYQYFIALAALVSYFVFYNVFNINLSIVQLFLFVLTLGKIRSREYTFAGILMGAAAINPYTFMVPLSILFLLNIKKRRSTVNTWAIITTILLSLLMVIFDMQWVLEYVKILVLETTTYPAISYGDYLTGVFPGINNLFFEIIPVILYSWLVIEWLKVPKENFIQEMWILCMGFILNVMLRSWVSADTTIAFLLVLLFAVSLWFDRSTTKFKYFSLAINALILVIIPIIQVFINKGLLGNKGIYWENIAIFLILILNLYWIRLWVINPYYAVNAIDDEY